MPIQAYLNEIQSKYNGGDAREHICALFAEFDTISHEWFEMKKEEWSGGNTVQTLKVSFS